MLIPGSGVVITAWFYRRLVLHPELSSSRVHHLSKDLFRKCLMLVSVNTDYLDWLVGRNIGERDRRTPG
jgi:hypothetical protein